MRKNEAGLTILEIGDVVRIGKGKVLYTVTVPAGSDGFVTVRSHNTDKPTTIERDRLNLVEAVQSVAYTAGCSVEELEVPTPNEAKENGQDSSREEVPVKEHTNYQKAILRALNVLGKHVYGGTVRNNVKAKRRGLDRRQKASRKVNR